MLALELYYWIIIYKYYRGKLMNLEQSGYESYFKVIVVGNAGVGKTNMIKTYEKGTKQNNIPPTVGLDYCSKVIKIDANHKAKIQIWDTAGHEQYRSLTLNHFKNSVGALIIYDVTNRQSFNDISRWLYDVRQRCNQNVVIAIVGNKVDSERRVVSRQQGESLASRQQLLYSETTIFDHQTLKNAFQSLAQRIYSQKKSKNLEFSRTNMDISLNSPNKSESNCQC